jgi:hypothetical protein
MLTYAVVVVGHSLGAIAALGAVMCAHAEESAAEALSARAGMLTHADVLVC